MGLIRLMGPMSPEGGYATYPLGRRVAPAAAGPIRRFASSPADVRGVRDPWFRRDSAK